MRRQLHRPVTYIVVRSMSFRCFILIHPFFPLPHRNSRLAIPRSRNICTTSRILSLQSQERCVRECVTNDRSPDTFALSSSASRPLVRTPFRAPTSALSVTCALSRAHSNMYTHTHTRSLSRVYTVPDRYPGLCTQFRVKNIRRIFRCAREMRSGEI